jgi:PIN domain nuclease of toxin-antitoxin system
LDLISADRHEVWVSTCSSWEIAIKSRLGKLDTPVALEAFENVLEGFELFILPITPPHVVAELSPAPSTKDLFDRLLLAQAQCERAKLITRDSKLAGHPIALIV